MATFVKLLQQMDDFVDETYRHRNEAEGQREHEFRSVIKVQSWYRGTRTRAYYKFLNACATAIQRRWRGYLGRQSVRGLLKLFETLNTASILIYRAVFELGSGSAFWSLEYSISIKYLDQVFIMKLNHYNAMATKVQKVWRGFYVRKYISNYYSRKRYLEGLVIKNEIVRNELEDHAELEMMKRQIKQDKESEAKLDEFAKKHHFLLSTHVMPGVFNSPYKQYPDEIEFHLRNAKAKIAKENKEKRKDQKETSNIFDPGCARYDLPRLKEPLPPLAKKPQGPFRRPDSVQSQRYKPFQPSLRVATNFFSLEEARQAMKDEEWVTRLNDDIFLPFKRKGIPYEKLLHSTSHYGHLPYGTKFFRHEYPIKWFTQNQNFQSVVPPIPIFEHLNDTYSQGQV